MTIHKGFATICGLDMPSHHRAPSATDMPYTDKATLDPALVDCPACRARLAELTAPPVPPQVVQPAPAPATSTKKRKARG